MTGHVAQLLDALDRKRLATSQARAALRGVVLQAIDGDDGRLLFIASMHALTKAFDELAEVEAWLDKIEGKA